MSGAESASDLSSDGDVAQFYRPGELDFLQEGHFVLASVSGFVNSALVLS